MVGAARTRILKTGSVPTGLAGAAHTKARGRAKALLQRQLRRKAIAG
jgi:hypothetical protein